MIQAFARDPHAACATKNATHASARDDYVARALRRFHEQRAAQCRQLAFDEAMDSYDDLVRYFERQVAGLWPYTPDTAAREVPATTMRALVARIEDAEDALAKLDGQFVRILKDHLDLWTVEPDSLSVSFRVNWRARKSQERHAEHLIGIDLEGVSTDENGVHTWRYASPIAVRLRLAKNSPYRFVGAADSARREWLHRGEGNGGLIRWFEKLQNGAWTVEADIADRTGVRQRLRVTAKVTDPQGDPITMPDFGLADQVGRGVEWAGNDRESRDDMPPPSSPGAQASASAPTI